MRGIVSGLLVAVALVGIGGSAGAQRVREPDGLQSFSSEAELAAFLRKVADNRTPPPPPPGGAPYAPPPVVASTVPAPSISADGGESIVLTGTRTAAPGESITNTQVQGVDEGGIVKLSGETLVILRRGRLFTVSLAGGGMRPVASIAAYPPGVDGSGDWYDEMLLAGDRVVVIGYSYRRGGTEVNRFRLNPDGTLRFEDSTQLKSNDYYSSRNYASRLVGTTLVYYTPLSIGWSDDDFLPALRRWQPGRDGGSWERIVTPQRVYVPRPLREAAEPAVDTVHTLVRCDLTAPRLDCDATAVLGSDNRSFFVSQNALYLWTVPGHVPDGVADGGMLYRLPLDGGRPGAVGVKGSPIDQFSFSPDPARSMLHVVVQSNGDGDGMWRAERSEEALALVDVPTALFGDGSREVPAGNYHALARPEGYDLQNRFVGDHLLLGSDGDRSVQVVALDGLRARALALPHAVGRLDAIGADAIVVGPGEGGLGFSSVALAAEPRVTDSFLLRSAREGESRSQAFFFRPDTADGSSGLMGLPVARVLRPGKATQQVTSAIQYLARDAGRLADAGELAARPERVQNDGCVASCVDWYGNARPIFWRGRVFALMGYELVEGREAGRRVEERARVSFAPGAGR